MEKRIKDAADFGQTLYGVITLLNRELYKYYEKYGNQGESFIAFRDRDEILSRLSTCAQALGDLSMYYTDWKSIKFFNEAEFLERFKE